MKVLMTFCSLLIFASGMLLLGPAASSAEKDWSKKVQMQYQDLKASMQKNLAEVDSEIEKLQIKAKDAGKDKKEKLNAQVEELKDMREDVAEKLDDLGDAAEDKYSRLKLDIEQSYENLKSKLKVALN